MNWIDIYLITNLLFILLVISGFFSKKFRFISYSFFFSLIFLYVGLFFIDKNFYSLGDTRVKDFELHEVETGQFSSIVWLKNLHFESKGIDTPIKNNDLDKLKIFFPLAGAPFLKTLYCIEDEKRIIYIADRYGFRNEDSLWNNNHDVLILGDSFAQGACVNKTITQNIIQSGFSSVSLGVSGNGPLTAHASLREYKNYFKSKYIFNLIYANDYSKLNNDCCEIDFIREISNRRLVRYFEDPKFIQHYFKPNYLSAYADYAKNQSIAILADKELKSTLRYKIDNLAYLLGYRVFKNVIKNLKITSSEFYSKRNIYLKNENLSHLLEIYNRNEEIAKKHNSVLINIVLPPKTCLLGDNSATWMYDILNKEIESELYNLSEDLCKEDLFAVRGSHYNEKGYKILSEKIIDYINNN
jgi:hypothetical protein